jgi:hypothetical protein
MYYVYKIHFINIILPSIARSFNRSLSFQFLYKSLPEFTFSAIRSTRMIFGDVYISWSFNHAIFLLSPATSSLLAPNILLNILFSNTLHLCAFLSVKDQISYPLKKGNKGSSVYFNIYTVKLIKIIINWSLFCQTDPFNSSQHTSVIKLTSLPSYPQCVISPR